MRLSNFVSLSVFHVNAEFTQIPTVPLLPQIHVPNGSLLEPPNESAQKEGGNSRTQYQPHLGGHGQGAVLCVGIK